MAKFIESEFIDRKIINLKKSYICSLYNYKEQYHIENDENNDDLIKIYVVEKREDISKSAITLFNQNYFNENTDIIVFVYLTDEIINGVLDKNAECLNRYKSQLVSTIVQEIKHCVDPTNQIFINYFVEKHENARMKFINKYLNFSEVLFKDKLFDVTTDSYNIYAETILNEEAFCIITSELKIDSSRSNGKLNYFQLLNDKIVVEKEILESCNVNYYNEFMEMLKKLNVFVLEKYIELSLKRFPTLIDCLNNFEFDIYGKKYVFNVELNKLFERN